MLTGTNATLTIGSETVGPVESWAVIEPPETDYSKFVSELLTRMCESLGIPKHLLERKDMDCCCCDCCPSEVTVTVGDQSQRYTPAPDCCASDPYPCMNGKCVVPKQFLDKLKAENDSLRAEVKELRTSLAGEQVASEIRRLGIRKQYTRANAAEAKVKALETKRAAAEADAAKGRESCGRAFRTFAARARLIRSCSYCEYHFDTLGMSRLAVDLDIAAVAAERAA